MPRIRILLELSSDVLYCHSRERDPLEINLSNLSTFFDLI